MKAYWRNLNPVELMILTKEPRRSQRRREKHQEIHESATDATSVHEC